MIGFKNGELNYATREWPTTGQSEMEVVIHALTELASHGRTKCSIIPDHMNNPDGSGDMVFVQCDERSLMFVNGKATDEQSGTTSVVEIQERIGLR